MERIGEVYKTWYRREITACSEWSEDGKREEKKGCLDD